MSDITTEQARKALGNGGSRHALQDEPKAETKTMVTTMPRSIFAITENQLGRMKALAQMVAASKFAFGKNLNEADAFLVMLKGIELGLEPMAALASIHNIQGVLTLSPQGMLALINRTGELDDLVIQGQSEQCSVTMIRSKRTPHTEIFTVEDAKAQGLVGKDNWKKQPAVMLKWRAVAACARIVFPDVIQGLYTQEEIGAEVAYTDDGGVIVDTPALPATVGTPVDNPTPPVTPSVPPKVETPPKKKAAKTEAPKDDTLPVKTEYSQQEVITQCVFMYGQGMHAANSISKMVANAEIIPSMTTERACVAVLFHRAKSDYEFSNDDVFTALSLSIDHKIEKWSQWATQGYGLSDAWQAIQDYNVSLATGNWPIEEAKSEPATPF